MKVEKEAAYAALLSELSVLLEEEVDIIACMAIVVAELHSKFPFYLWTGFYRVIGKDELVLGPYQGTPGCFRIQFGRGVCGASAKTKKTIVVPDVHKYPGHITCDTRSNSEIVVPVLNNSGDVIAVLDIDSEDFDAFGKEDQKGLEEIVKLLKEKVIIR